MDSNPEKLFGEIYLDHNSSTPIAPRVKEAIIEHLHHFANPSSLHSPGREVWRRLELARGQVAEFLGVTPEEIVFTSSGSEADNLAIKGIAKRHRDKPCHIITSQIEHSATLGACKYLESSGFAVTYLSVDSAGRVDPNDVRRSIRSDTRLIAIMHANNETGVIQPVEEVSEIAREAEVAFFSDAVQTAGKLPREMLRFPADLLAISGHKIYGPKGIGALVVRSGTLLQPLIHGGGGQEFGLRGGTENVLGIIGIGAACDEAQNVLPTEFERQRRMRDRLWEGLCELGDVQLNGDLRYMLPGTLNVGFRYIKGDALATALAFENIAVATGSACHAHEVKPSHVLQAMGLTSDWLFAAVRFSIGHDNTYDEIEHVLGVVSRAVKKLRVMSSKARGRL